mmetsp:Transcript_3715/g.7051  ORF Transcript_3715/g.7051 Transcript_3715/m.7051 type:complete len:276 (-) Transcript_3715:114-941(-)
MWEDATLSALQRIPATTGDSKIGNARDAVLASAAALKDKLVEDRMQKICSRLLNKTSTASETSGNSFWDSKAKKDAPIKRKHHAIGSKYKLDVSPKKITSKEETKTKPEGATPKKSSSGLTSFWGSKQPKQSSSLTETSGQKRKKSTRKENGEDKKKSKKKNKKEKKQKLNKEKGSISSTSSSSTSSNGSQIKQTRSLAGFFAPLDSETRPSLPSPQNHNPSSLFRFSSDKAKSVTPATPVAARSALTPVLTKSPKTMSSLSTLSPSGRELDTRR